jgi:micrococcal nuclease
MEMHWPSAKVLRWVDGDTCELLIDTGFHNSRTQMIRLVQINTPERGKPGYREATAYANSLAPAGSAVSLTTYKDDAWDRYLGDVVNEQGVHIHTALLENGFATLYKRR